MAAGDFLASRGMGEAQGKKVDPSAVAAQAVEAQPSFGQIKPWRGRVVRAEQHPQKKRGRTSNVPPKRSGLPGEERKSHRTDKTRTETDQSLRTAPPPRERLSVGLEPLASTNVTGTATFPVTRTSGHRAEIRQPVDDEGQAHLSLVAAANRSDAAPAKTPRSRYGGANASCARRPRRRQEQRPRLQRPRATRRIARRYARARASCGCSDGGRHGKDKTDCADGPRADRCDGEAANRKGRPAG